MDGEVRDVTLIGGSGFIGSCLISVLNRQQISVINLDKQTSPLAETRITDVRDYKSLQENTPGCKWLVLLAAEHKDNVQPVSLYYDVNVEGARQVCRMASEKKIQRILFTSTVAVYGLNKINPDENHPVHPFNDYGKSKYQAEEVLRAWFEESPHERTLVILRPTVVFGPGNRGNVFNLLRQILHGRFRMVGSGTNIKSMSYVGNLVAFILHCLQQQQAGYSLYNYVDKPDLNTNQLIEIISRYSGKAVHTTRIPYPVAYLAGLVFDVLSRLSGKEFPISSVRVKKFCATTQFANTRMQESGFKAPHTLEEGLAITIKSLMS